MIVMIMWRCNDGDVMVMMMIVVIAVGMKSYDRDDQYYLFLLVKPFASTIHNERLMSVRHSRSLEGSKAFFTLTIHLLISSPDLHEKYFVSKEFEITKQY